MSGTILSSALFYMVLLLNVSFNQHAGIKIDARYVHTSSFSLPSLTQFFHQIQPIPIDILSTYVSTIKVEFLAWIVIDFRGGKIVKSLFNATTKQSHSEALLHACLSNRKL